MEKDKLTFDIIGCEMKVHNISYRHHRYGASIKKRKKNIV